MVGSDRMARVFPQRGCCSATCGCLGSLRGFLADRWSARGRWGAPAAEMRTGEYFNRASNPARPGDVVKVQIGLHLGHGRNRGLGRGVPRDGADTFIGVAAPCEVLVSEVTDTQATFCYRALPGHPVAGEERFHLQWIPAERTEGGGRLVATVSAYSRPVAWYTKWGGPVARAAQRYFAKRYARAMLARA